VIDAGGIFTSVATGAGLGTLGCPVICTAIGGFVAGVVYIVGVDIWQPGGQSIRERVKESMYKSKK
jgi:hypothetical protein